MTRITNNYVSKVLVSHVLQNRANVNKFSEEVSTGLKVRNPGESRQAGTVDQFKQLLQRIDGYKNRLSNATSFLSLQEDLVFQANEIMARTKEIATQAANETNSNITRFQMAEEVFQLRDQLVNLANTTYQGRYVYGGADDDDPPYDLGAPYTEPVAGGSASERYVFDAEAGTNITRTVQVTDDLAIRVNSTGNSVFDNSIQALERLGRALAGFETLPAAGAPDGTGVPYVFPADFDTQTQAIANSIDLINTARENDLMPERINLGSRLARLQTAESLLDLTKTNGEQVINQIQNADVVESASNLSLAQTAFEASLQVTLRALNLSILEFL